MKERKNGLWFLGICLLIEIAICCWQFCKYGMLTTPVTAVICVGIVAWCFGYHVGSYSEYKKIIRDLEKIMEDEDGKE